MPTKKNNGHSRRDFMKISGTALGGLPVLGVMPMLSNCSTATDELSVHIFSKHLQFLDYENMAEAAKKIGFDGVDLTVRPKGHVLPERVEEDLPRATEAIKSVGFTPNMFTSKIVNVDEPHTKTVLKTASDLGYKSYRTGWFKYPEDVSLDDTIEHINQQFKALAELNKSLGLMGGYQNHSGKKNVGAPIWDIPLILKDIDPKYLGCHYDIRHATAEGGQGWALGLRRVRPHINTIVIKDFHWKIINGKWKIFNTPMGEGMVDFKRYFSLLKSYNMNLPISLHCEYDLGGAEKGKSELTISHQEVFDRMKKDLTFLRTTWAVAE